MAPRSPRILGRPPASDGVLTRQRILDAAQKLFGERGYERSTNKDIAEAAGITMGSIYYYYESKQDLYVGVCEEVRGLCLAALELASASQAGFVERIRTALERLAVANRARSSLAFFVVSAPTDARRYPELRDAVDHLVTDLQAWCRTVTADGMARGEIAEDSDEEAVADLVWSLLFGMAYFATMAPPPTYGNSMDHLERLVTGALTNAEERG